MVKALGSSKGKAEFWCSKAYFEVMEADMSKFNIDGTL